MAARAFIRSKRIKALFFDMNETLLDPVRTQEEAFKTVWEDMAGRWDGGGNGDGSGAGKPMGEQLWEQYTDFLGNKTSSGPGAKKQPLEQLRREALAMALDSGGIRWKDTMTDAFLRKMKEEQARRPVLYSGTEDVIRALAERYRLAIISNGSKEKLVHQLQAASLLPPFLEAHLFASSALGVRKPAAGIYRKALEAVGVQPHQAVMIGNSWRKDVMGAVGAGMHAVWLRASYKGTSSRRKIGSSRVLTIRQLEQLLDDF